MRHLLLRLEAPMMAFGDVAVDERLSTARFPALSMVCGLIANARGFLRTEPVRIGQLQDAMEIASRLDRPGYRMRDYQTALIDGGDEVWTSTGRVSGRDGAASGQITVQLDKEFWSDASVTVAVALSPDEMEATIAALENPARPLFLGRAACPPSRPVLLGTIEATDVLDALRRTPMDDDRVDALLDAQWPDRLGGSEGTRLVFASDLKDWANRIHVGTRRVREGRITVEKAR